MTMQVRYFLLWVQLLECPLGENFLEIYGRERDHEPEQKWSDLIMVLESDLDLWKRVARRQAIRIESGPSLASLISDEPSTTLIYGVLIGIFAGCILPSWMFFLILIGTVWYIGNRMPPALLVVIQKTIEGAMQGDFSSVQSSKVCIANRYFAWREERGGRYFRSGG